MLCRWKSKRFTTLFPGKELDENGNALLNNNKDKCDRGEMSYHEKIPSTVYKMVFSRLTLDELKISRIVCQRWHSEIFQLLEDKSCFVYRGSNDVYDLRKARKLSDFLRVVQRDGFQWKMLRVLYQTPEHALPTPVLIQWSHIVVHNSCYPELRQWASRHHIPNAVYLEFQNVNMHWSRYLIILREFEHLEKFRDGCTPFKGGIRLGQEDFDRDFTCSDKLEDSIDLRSLQMPQEEITFLSTRLKHVIIHRSRLEELVLFMKLLTLMGCKVLEVLDVQVHNCYGSCRNNELKSTNEGFLNAKRKNMRPIDVKSILFFHLGILIKANAETLESIRLSFGHYTISECFDQYSKYYYDNEVNLYKPDLRNFIAHVNQNRWSTFNLSKLTDLTIEMENKKIASVEEIEGFSQFLNSLKSLKRLYISHFLLTSYNSLSLPLILKRLGKSLFDTVSTKSSVNFGVSLRNEVKAQLNLPTNLDLYYPFLNSIVVTCNSEDTNVQPTLFSSRMKKSSTELNHTEKQFNLVRDFWVVDNRPGKRTLELFQIKQLVDTYPNLTTLIIQDMKHSLQCNADNLNRWAIIDDNSMQHIIRSLTELKHLDLSGNLIHLTDCGVTGLSYDARDRLLQGNAEPIHAERELVGKPISNLKKLEFCSLQYLGSKVTDLTLRLGFCGVSSLRHLRLLGLVQITAEAISSSRENFFPFKDGYELVVLSSCL